MDSNNVIEKIKNGEYDELFIDIYVDKNRIENQKKRYIDAITSYMKKYGGGEIEIYSAPGRSEIGGNHTDHQQGEVLAAAINLDAIAVVQKREDNTVNIMSDGYDEIVLCIGNGQLDMVEEEKGTTKSLIKGIIAKMKENGHKTGGFNAYITSDVLVGAGLSSSAAYETLIGTIMSGLYNNMSVSPVEIAMIGQYTENVYFGKPCGLMDQMACSVGNLVHIDFKEPKNPIIQEVLFDLDKYGFSLCITDTKGSHADLTDDYAAIPKEMKEIAQLFDKEVLCEVSKENILNNISKLREKAGDRAVLRAIHFINENERVRAEVSSINDGDIEGFLKLVKKSGDSSYKYLQNVYANNDISHQNVSVALAVSDMILGENGVSRVHGGGFAGTIQAFVKKDYVDNYKKQMDGVFGEGACVVLEIRKYGGLKVL